VGDSSKEWGALKGEVLQTVIDNRTKEGVVDAAGVFDYLNKPTNAPMVDRLLNPQDKKVLLKMLKEGANVDASGVMTGGQKKVFEDGLEQIINFTPDPKTIVKRVYSWFGSSAKAIDYLTDEAFMKAAQKAYGPEQTKILEAARMASDLRSKLKVVEVGSAHGERKKAVIKRYAPSRLGPC
jgi:hypothetical protein